MATPSKSMTTSEFAKATGIPAATISKLIREGKLKARKEGQGWMIPQGQLEAKVVRELGKPPKPTKAKKAKKPSTPAVVPPPAKTAKPVRRAPAPSEPKVPAAPVPPPEPVPEPAVGVRPKGPSTEKTYSASEFAAMTYLTEKGVSEWLRTGRLQGIRQENGELRVLASNLQVPDISRLVRK
jgi:excisionase family DNA binding protein